MWPPWTGRIGGSPYRALWVNLLLVPSWFVLQVNGHQLDLVLQTLERKQTNQASLFEDLLFSQVQISYKKKQVLRETESSSKYLEVPGNPGALSERAEVANVQPSRVHVIQKHKHIQLPSNHHLINANLQKEEASSAIAWFGDLPGGAVEDGWRLGGGAEGRRERLFRGGAACTGVSIHLARTRAERRESQCQFI